MDKSSEIDCDFENKCFDVPKVEFFGLNSVSIRTLQNRSTFGANCRTVTNAARFSFH
jgi:hypothetical protein